MEDKVFFDIAGEAGLNGKRATARSAGRGVDCRESAIHPACRRAPTWCRSQISALGSRRVKKYAYVRLMGKLLPERHHWQTCRAKVRAGTGGHWGWPAETLEGVEGRGMGVQITKRTQFFRNKANESA